MINIAEKLKEHHLKVTPQRLAIFGYLAGTTSHPNVEMIYNNLKADYPSMSLATVYKTVASLKEANLVQELSMGEDSCRYDANISFHPHLFCLKCNEVYDFFSDDMLKEAREKIKEELGFEVQSEQVYFYGCCKNCKDK